MNKVIFHVKKFMDRELKGTHFIILWVFFTLMNSLFGFDLIYYTISALVLLYILLCSEKLYPVFTLLSIFYLSPSRQNNPGTNADSIFFPENGMIYLIVLIVVLAALFLYRIIRDYRRNRYFPKLTMGFLGLGVFLTLGGIGYAAYTPLTILFGFIVFAAMSFFYFIGIIPLQQEEIPEDYFFKLCFYAAVNISVQVIAAYLTNDVIVDGVVHRSQIWFGWANYNGSGCMLAMLMPVAIFLATKPKVGWIYYLGCCFFEVILFANQSRDAFTIGTILFVIASVFAFVKSSLATRIVIGSVLLCGAGVIFYCIKSGESYINKLITDFCTFFDEGASGEARVNIFKVYWELFKEYPIFGTGFYSTNTGKWGTVDYDFVPALAHNTWLQMLGSCGILGLLAYLFHRLQTFLITFKRPSFRKIFYFFGVSGIILTSIIDCHFFNLGPSLTYAMLLALIELEDSPNKRQELLR